MILAKHSYLAHMVALLDNTIKMTTNVDSSLQGERSCAYNLRAIEVVVCL
jgi:hypothetical protein